jgi:hypothetical protein
MPPVLLPQLYAMLLPLPMRLFLLLLPKKG